MTKHVFFLVGPAPRHNQKMFAFLQGGRGASGLRGSCAERTQRKPSRWQTARRVFVPLCLFPMCMFSCEKPHIKLCCMQMLGGRTVVADWAVPKAQFAPAAVPAPGMLHRNIACTCVCRSKERLVACSGGVQVRWRLERILEMMLWKVLMVQRWRVNTPLQSWSRALRSACCRASWSSWSTWRWVA